MGARVRQIVRHAQSPGDGGAGGGAATCCSTSTGRARASSRRSCPTDVVSIFILPPDGEALERRLRARGLDSAEVVARRMAAAASEIEHWSEYDYVLVNSDLDASLAALQSILNAERLKRERQTGMAAFVAGVLASL